MKNTLIFILIFPCFLFSQTDYNQLSNWYYHPNKLFNFIENYNLDIAVINSELQIDSIIRIDNNSGNNTGVDVFWVHPTHLTNPPLNPTSIPIQDQDINYISLAILGQGALLSKYGRFYAPKYRQASPASFLGLGSSELERANALIDTYLDIKAAFLNYLTNQNNGNRIILAGHSQGSFLIAMLLRDLFDNDTKLKDKLVTAALGGMGYVYSAQGTFKGGWWENIPLCTNMNECGCVHFWRSYEESETIPQPDSNFPSFNQVLKDSGLVFRTTDLDNDLLLQDSLYYGSDINPLRYYIAPDASYNFAQGYNIIAFDSLYSIRFKRESNLTTGFSLEKIDNPNDLRPNDVDSMQTNPFFSDGNLHIKDYHIYIWALMEQIDSKLEECKLISRIENKLSDYKEFSINPNPSSGIVRINTSSYKKSSINNSFRILNNLGQLVQSFEMDNDEKLIQIRNKGIYFIISNYGCKKLIIN